MVFGLCCQREGLYRSLYIVHIFILVGVMYYCLQKSVGKSAPDSEPAGESLQPEGETLRPVWGLMDKCYPVTTQRRRVHTGKKQASGTMTPWSMAGQNDAASKEESRTLPQEEGQERRRYQQGAAVCPSEVENVEEGPGSWGPQLLRMFWPSWFPAIDTPKMQNHE